MKKYFTKTIASIVFVVFLGVLGVENVSAGHATYHNTVDRDWKPYDEGYSISSDAGTVCKYESSSYTSIVEINNAGIGIRIKHGKFKGKFIRNWEHNNEKNDYGLIRGNTYYANHEKDCPEYLVICEWGHDANHYYLSDYSHLDDQEDKCSDKAKLPGDDQWHMRLKGIYQVPVVLPEVVIVEDTPVYICEYVGGKYYDINGVEASEDDFHESCATAGIRGGQITPLSENNEVYSCGQGYLTDIPKSLLRFTRIFYIILQILVPIALVIMGSLDLLKSVAAQKEDEIKKGQQIFFKRLIAAITVFFVFAIIKFMISIISNESQSITDCMNCFIEGPDSSSCV